MRAGTRKVVASTTSRQVVATSSRLRDVAAALDTAGERKFWVDDLDTLEQEIAARFAEAADDPRRQGQ